MSLADHAALTPLPTALLHAAEGVHALPDVQLSASDGVWLQQLMLASLIPGFDGDLTTQPRDAEVRWTDSRAVLADGDLACSSSDQQIPRLADSLAVGLPVDLSDALSCQDSGSLCLVLSALWHANGAPPRASASSDLHGGGGAPGGVHPLQGGQSMPSGD